MQEQANPVKHASVQGLESSNKSMESKTNYANTLNVHYVIPTLSSHTNKGKLDSNLFKVSTPHSEFSHSVSIEFLLKCSTIWQMAERNQFLQCELMLMNEKPSMNFSLIKFASEKLGQAVKKLWKNRNYNLEPSHLKSLSPDQIKKLAKDPILLLNLQIFMQSAFLLCNLKGISLALWKDHCESRFLLLAMAVCYGVKSGLGKDASMKQELEKEYEEFYTCKASSVWILFVDFCESFYKEKRFKISVLGIVMKKIENWLWLVKILKSPNKAQAIAVYQLHLREMGSDVEIPDFFPRE